MGEIFKLELSGINENYQEYREIAEGGGSGAKAGTGGAKACPNSKKADAHVGASGGRRGLRGEGGTRGEGRGQRGFECEGRGNLCDFR